MLNLSYLINNFEFPETEEAEEPEEEQEEEQEEDTEEAEDGLMAKKDDSGDFYLVSTDEKDRLEKFKQVERKKI